MTPRAALAIFFIVVLGATLALGCAYYEDRITETSTRWLSPIDERVIHGDTQFSPAERVAAERACFEWALFTRGRVRLSVRWDLDDTNYITLPGPLLYRVSPSPDTGHYGGRTDGDRIWWVPETCRDLQACMMHEIGHMLGLCNPPRGHVAHSGQVMSASDPAHTFGLGDYQECIDVGVCRARQLDVTTVTVTVDPSVPNIEPEYPRTP